MAALFDPLTENAPGAVATGAPGARRIDRLFSIPYLARMGYANLWHCFWSEAADGWSEWEPRGGSDTSAPGPVAYGGGRLDVFFVTATNPITQADDALTHESSDDRLHWAWETLPLPVLG